MRWKSSILVRISLTFALLFAYLRHQVLEIEAKQALPNIIHQLLLVLDRSLVSTSRNSQLRQIRRLATRLVVLAFDEDAQVFENDEEGMLVDHFDLVVLFLEVLHLVGCLDLYSDDSLPAFYDYLQVSRHRFVLLLLPVRSIAESAATDAAKANALVVFSANQLQGHLFKLLDSLLLFNIATKRCHFFEVEPCDLRRRQASAILISLTSLVASNSILFNL